jgi:hypothetical protein
MMVSLINYHLNLGAVFQITFERRRRFQKPEPDWRAQTKLQFGASPIGSVKAFENVVKRQKRLTRAAERRRAFDLC